MSVTRLAAAALCAAFISAGAVAQTPAPAPAAETALFSPEQLRFDLDVIWNASVQGDPAFDRYRSQRQLARIFTQARNRIDRPMSELEFYRIAAPAVAALGNGHATLSLSPARAEWLAQTAPMLPIGVRVLHGSAYVFRDFSAGQTVGAGGEIVSINNVPMRALLHESIAAMAMDGMSLTPRENSAGGWRILYDLVRLRDMGPTYVVQIRERGALRTITLAGRTGSEIARDWRRQFPNDAEIAERAPASLSFEPDLAIIRVPHWDHPVEGQPGLSEQFRDWFAQIAQRNPPALVIDIRDNGGGAEPIATELLTYLADRPLRYYTCLSMNAADFDFLRYSSDAAELRSEIPEYTRPASPECRASGALEMTEAAFPNLGVQQPRQPHYGGRVYLLINSSSFSTSAEFASVFAALQVGEIVGQETAGGYLGNSSGFEAPVRLPATGMIFSANLIAYHMAVPRHRGTQGGVRPDTEVPYRIEDLLAGRDLEMEAVRASERRR